MAHRESEIPMLTERWPLPVVKVYKCNGIIYELQFFRMIRNMNARNPSGCDLQLYGHYASLIMSIFPNLQDCFTRAISELGGMVSIVNTNWPSRSTDDICQPSKLMVPVCQLFLLLFKTSSSQSYENDMKSTITAIKSIARYTITDAEIDQIAIKFELAQKIRIMLGSKRYLRKFLFEAIHKESELDSPFGRGCNYVVRKLAWTDMSELVLINDVLLVNYSPVLKDARVASEVQNLHETFNAVDQSSSPQFFGITSIGVDERLLDNLRFPLLIKVAQRVRPSHSFTTSQFITSPVNDHTVSQLVAIHEAYMRGNTARSTGVLLSSLQL